jgi:predicted nucleic acid-binding protein
MPEIVSNTTPLISLLIIDKLNLLKEIYGKIYVPYAVFKELEQGNQKAYYQDISKINWIKIVNISNKKLNSSLLIWMRVKQKLSFWLKN